MDKTIENMTFDDALTILGIEEYKERIFNSNSRGELFHLHDYYVLAKFVRDTNQKLEFENSFHRAVKHAENHWERPESVFQHIMKML